jgi:hypothetical protein
MGPTADSSTADLDDGGVIAAMRSGWLQLA